MKVLVIASLALITASVMAAVSRVRGVGDPILLVPGVSGSRLDVKHSGFTLCNTLGNSVGLWVSAGRLLKYGCFSQEMTLVYDEDADQYSESYDDITVTVPGFGETESVEQLGNGLFYIPYLKDFVEYFVERGYERGKTIRAAPYDWRLAPNELEKKGYYDRFKSLVEEMYQENGNTKVTIVTHSMGSPTTLHFLTSGKVSQTWKDTYIGNFITLSGAWSGGNEALQTQVSGLTIVNHRPGDMFDIFVYVGGQIRESLRPIMRSHQSLSFLLPRPSVWGDTVLVSTPTQTYTANDYERLFSDIGLADGYAKYQGVERINENFPAPNVPTHCFYGVGVDTPLSFTYKESFPKGADSDPETVTMGDGDGTVNIQSSEVCLHWANSDQPFNHKTFAGVNHADMVTNEEVLKEVEKVVTGERTSSHVQWPGSNAL